MGIVSQWVWNLRLELGHQHHPDPVRTTEFAPAISSPSHTPPPSGYAPPQVGLPWKAGRFSGQDFALQPDGTLRCPAEQKLTPHEQHRKADGSLRVVYGASIRRCRPCPLRAQCQWNGGATAMSHQVSVRFASSPGWSRAASLAGLEPERTPARLYAVCATPTHGGKSVATRCRFARHSGCDPVMCSLRTFSPLMARTVRLQCAAQSLFPGHDQAARYLRSGC